jgi:hypothetical protein
LGGIPPYSLNLNPLINFAEGQFLIFDQKEFKTKMAGALLKPRTLR